MFRVFPLGFLLIFTGIIKYKKKEGRKDGIGNYKNQEVLNEYKKNDVIFPRRI